MSAHAQFCIGLEGRASPLTWASARSIGEIVPDADANFKLPLGRMARLWGESMPHKWAESIGTYGRKPLRTMSLHTNQGNRGCQEIPVLGRKQLVSCGIIRTVWNACFIDIPGRVWVC